jgi:hypothetical protein
MKNLLLCGAGSAGANSIMIMIRDIPEIQKVVIIDFDKIEERNLNTQPWKPSHVGEFKCDVLDELISDFGSCDSKFYNKRIESVQELLDIIQKEKINVVMDCFDNVPSRNMVGEACSKAKVDCLHIGFAPEGSWLVQWDDKWVPMTESAEENRVDICELQGVYAFLIKVSAYASLSMNLFVKEGKKQSFLGNVYTTHVL